MRATRLHGMGCIFKIADAAKALRPKAMARPGTVPSSGVIAGLAGLSVLKGQRSNVLWLSTKGAGQNVLSLFATEIDRRKGWNHRLKFSTSVAESESLAGHRS